MVKGKLSLSRTYIDCRVPPYVLHIKFCPPPHKASFPLLCWCAMHSWNIHVVSDFQFGLFRCRCSSGSWDYGRASRAKEGDSEEDQEELPQ